MASSSSVNIASFSTSLRLPQKLRDTLNSGGVSSVLAASMNKNTCYIPIRCRFTRPSTSTPNRSRRAGMASPLEATVTGAPTSVPVKVAHELLQAGHLYLDVRTPEEFSAGRVPGAVNVPYMFRMGSGMAKNPNFLAEVSLKFGKDDEILIGCQSGKRSIMAANDLRSAGYTSIIDVAGGYAAWIQSELSTEV